MEERLKESTSVTIKAIILNFILVILKIMAGIFGKSTAMIADGIHSASDMITSLGVLIKRCPHTCFFSCELGQPFFVMTKKQIYGRIKV